MAQTQAKDLINPEVLADVIGGKLEKEIRFSPFAVVDTTLEGQPGDTITRPKYAYIGAAEDLEEGVAMDTAKLSMTTTQVTVKEIGKSTEITEKALITNLDGTLKEHGEQLALSLAEKVDMDYVEVLKKAKLSAKAPVNVNGLLDAIDVFDSERELELVLFINPKDYTKLVKSLFSVGGDVQNRAIKTGEVAELVGVSHIVKTKRADVGKAYLQKVGAVEIVSKKKPAVHSDYDVLKRVHVVATNQHYVVNLKDDNGAVVITFEEPKAEVLNSL